MRYRDKKQAIFAMRAIQRKSDRGRVPCRVYWCAACRGWHMTSNPY